MFYILQITHSLHQTALTMMSDYVKKHHQTGGLYKSVSMECGGVFVGEELGKELQKCYVPNLDIREGVREVYMISAVCKYYHSFTSGDQHFAKSPSLYLLESSIIILYYGI